MSVCAQSGQPEEDSGLEEVTAARATERDLYKQKPASKVVRVLTVLAYLLSVSLAAILLSVYYVCVWDSPESPLPNSTVTAGSLSAIPPSSANAGAAYHADGGSDSAVNALVDPLPVPSDSTQTASLEADASPDTVPTDTSATDTLEPLNATFPSDEDFNGTTTSVT